MDPKALYNITYGLYLLSARENGKDNGCIINTAVQIAENPVRIGVSVSKRNLTHDMVLRTGHFNVSTLCTDTPFDVFKRFGMQSGRDADKFSGFDGVQRAENGLLRLTDYTNAYFAAKVVSAVDLGTHTFFIGEVTEGEVLSQKAPCTYGYYQSHIKPKPAPVKKKAWVCEVCGYVYEGDEVPEDYVCPLCNHGKEAFRPADGSVQSALPVEKASGKRRWKCTVCGYEAEGEVPPDECPLCHQGAERFEEVK